jgi:hypothetical protein
VASPELDFDRFHREELPRRLAAGNGALAAHDLAGQPALGFRLRSGNAYTYAPRADGVAILAGDDAAHTVVTLDAAAWRDFVSETRTVPSLLYGGQLEVPRGAVDVLFRWETPLRALYFGRPLFDPAALALRDRAGRPLDLGATFTLASPRDELVHFLAEAGFCVVRAAFTPAEIARFSDEADRLCAAARQGDRRSWWARNAAGEQVLCRVTYASLGSEVIASLNDDPRVRALAAAYRDDLRPAPDRLDGIAVILKHPAIVDGLADLPWHVDCGMGGHPLMCPVLQVSLLLDDATPATGTLEFLTGSHRFAARAPRPDERDLPIVSVDARRGDVILHLSDTMHAAPPPRGAERYRRSLVTSFYRPAVFDLIPVGKGFNDVLLARADGHVENLRTRADELTRRPSGRGRAI